MKKLFIISLLLLATLLKAQTLIPIDSIPNYLGQHIQICEHVSDVYKAVGDNKSTFINFGGKYPNNTFTIVILAKDYPNFPFAPVEHLKDKNVCVQGVVTYHKDKPQIVARHPEQINVIN